MARARATRSSWYSAAAGLMGGSRPLADAVTRSTGTADLLSGSASCRAASWVLTASSCAGLVGPRFDPAELAPLYGCGVVAEGRGQKYFGSSNGWPISEEPITRPFWLMSEPCAWRAQHTAAMP